jgi:hypothetical protein
MTPRLARHTRSVVLCVAVLVAAAFVTVAPARAQFGMMGGGDFTQFMAPVSKRSIETYAALLGMDKEQKEAALALQEGYKSSFSNLTAQMQKAFKEMGEKAQDTQDYTVFSKEAPKIGKEFGEKMEKLEKGFFEDVKTLLSEQQQERWPRVERARRRETGLRFGFVSGQNLDLIKILGAIGVKTDASPELAQQVERYELDMDKGLQAMERWGKEQQAKQGEIDPMHFDMGKMQDMMKQLGEMAKQMRDVNRQYTRTLAPLLPADKQAKFEDEIKRKSFPRVYRESYASKALAEAANFADLDATQRDSIAALKSTYERDLDAANRKWAAAIEEREEKAGGSIMAMMGGLMGNRDGSDAIGDARKARKELDERTKDRLVTLLREDQQKRLPEDKADPKEGFGMDMFNIEPPEQDD